MGKGRPPKDPDQLLNVPLRVMVTAAQREVIDEAIRLEGSEFSEWAREILVDAARRRVHKGKGGAGGRRLGE